MSRTLSVLIVENFVFNEGPKLDKFKSGAKKVGQGVALAAVLSSVALGGKGLATKYDANRNYYTDKATSEADYLERFHELNKNHKDAISNIDNIEGMKLDSKNRAKDVIIKNYDEDMADNLTNKTNKQVEATYRKDNQHKEGNQDLAGAGGLAGIGTVGAGAVALAAGSKDDKKKKEKKTETLQELSPALLRDAAKKRKAQANVIVKHIKKVSPDTLSKAAREALPLAANRVDKQREEEKAMRLKRQEFLKKEYEKAEDDEDYYNTYERYDRWDYDEDLPDADYTQTSRLDDKISRNDKALAKASKKTDAEDIAKEALKQSNRFKQGAKKRYAKEYESKIADKIKNIK